MITKSTATHFQVEELRLAYADFTKSVPPFITIRNFSAKMAVADAHGSMLSTVSVCHDSFLCSDASEPLLQLICFPSFICG